MRAFYLLASLAAASDGEYRVNMVDVDSGLDVHPFDGINSPIGTIHGGPKSQVYRYMTSPQTNIDIIQSMIDYLVSLFCEVKRAKPKKSG